MIIENIAILLTCHNRLSKTRERLESLFKADLPHGVAFKVFLVDDGSTDGTGEFVMKNYPEIDMIKGNGNLFWAGGMRLAWTEALKSNFDGYLLLNDDTILSQAIFIELLTAHSFSISTYGKPGIYIGSTQDQTSMEFTYGGHQTTNKLSGKSHVVRPNSKTNQSCDFANGNILFIHKNVFDSLGILSTKFTHLLADFDYTLSARKKGFPLLICKNYCGACQNDHPKNWLSGDFPLSERIEYLKNPKHLAYSEYLFFIRKHFPFYLATSFLKLWTKTLFPFVWDRYKKIG